MKITGQEAVVIWLLMASPFLLEWVIEERAAFGRACHWLLARTPRPPRAVICRTCHRKDCRHA